MLKATGNGVRCEIYHCEFYSQGQCALNTWTELNLVTKECQTTNNWYVTGSFVLDKVFGETTARDIDLVMPQGEKPKELPGEIVRSPLVIEMLWPSGKEPHGLEYHNISLPRITSKGFVNWDIAEELRTNKTLSVLPGIRKVPAQIVFTTVKSVVKYALKIDEKCFYIWNKSVLNPPAWRTYHLLLIRYGYFKGRQVDWDFEKANYLIDRLERAYKGSTEYEKGLYLNKLVEIMNQMDISKDKGCSTFLQYVRALTGGNAQEQQNLKQLIRQGIISARARK